MHFQKSNDDPVTSKKTYVKENIESRILYEKMYPLEQFSYGLISEEDFFPKYWEGSVLIEPCNKEGDSLLSVRMLEERTIHRRQTNKCGISLF